MFLITDNRIIFSYMAFISLLRLWGIAFCERYISFKDRHHDQMIQAARSGYQNIAEGGQDSATSKKLELNLTNVARSSLDELRKDYLKYLMRRHLCYWEKEEESLFLEARSLRPQTLERA